MATDFTAPRLYDLRDLREVKIGSDGNGDYYALPVIVQGNPVSTGIFIGQVGGDTDVIPVTVTASSGTYSAGQSIGGLLTIDDAMRVDGGNGVFHSFTMVDHGAVRPLGSLIIFSSPPTSSNFTDKAAVSIHDNDEAKVLGIVTLTTPTPWVSVGSKGVMTVSNIGLPVNAVSTKKLYAVFMVSSTPAPTVSTVMTAQFGFLRD